VHAVEAAVPDASLNTNFVLVPFKARFSAVLQTILSAGGCAVVLRKVARKVYVLIAVNTFAISCRFPQLLRFIQFVLYVVLYSLILSNLYVLMLPFVA